MLEKYANFVAGLRTNKARDHALLGRGVFAWLMLLFFFCPNDREAFGHVLTMLQAGKTKYVIFDGPSLQYGRASIKGLPITGEYDPEDY